MDLFFTFSPSVFFFFADELLYFSVDSLLQLKIKQLAEGFHIDLQKAWNELNLVLNTGFPGPL